MTTYNFFNSLSNNVKQIVNKIQKTTKKLINCKHAIEFNGLCLKEDILPKYTNIYIYIWVIPCQLNQWLHGTPSDLYEMRCIEVLYGLDSESVVETDLPLLV